MNARASLLLILIGAGCGSASSDSPDAAAVAPGADARVMPARDSGTPTPAPDGGSPWRDPDGGCVGGALLQGLGRDHVLAGFAGEEAVGEAAPFDLEYRYLAGGGLPDAPCASCASGCNSTWWGCWQWDALPPGEYVRGFVSRVAGNGAIPMITYYELLHASGVAEGVPTEVNAANDVALMRRLFNDFRFLLQQFGSSPGVVHVEPDFWGYCEHVNENPHLIPAAVASANPTDCAGLENSIAGMGRCFVAMARRYAPQVRIGLHGSAWGTKIDALMNTNPSLDVGGEARKLGRFLKECGAAESDFVGIDASDRDAGYYQSIGRAAWWDATNATLPHFHQAFAWAKALAEEVGRPVLWWQVPVGNMALPDVSGQWRDNRVDYFFAHTGELAAAHGVGMAFGAGADGQTTPSTDGNNLVNKTVAYRAAGRQRLCP